MEIPFLAVPARKPSKEILAAAQTYELQQRQGHQAQDSQPASAETDEKDSAILPYPWILIL